jgi:two-component system response regulator YesN
VVDNASDSKCENDNKSEFLHKLIRSQKLNDEEMDCNRFELRLDFAKSNVAVICMTVDNYKYIIDKDLQTSGSNILSKSLINMLNEISANEMCELLDNGNGEVVFFIGEGRDTVDFCKYIQEALSRYLNISVSFGISNYCSNWKLISEHYEQSRAAVEGKFYSGFGSINHFKDIIEYDNQVKLYTYDEEKRLFDMLSSGKYIEVHEYIRCLFKNLERAYSSPDRIIEAINEVFNTFCRAAKYFGGDINSMNNSGITTSQVMKDLETLKNIEEWLYRFIERFEEYISKIRKSKLRSEISEVLDYINANYSKDIDLNSAAGYVNISPAHFCTVFKKEVGVSFTDYVTSLRVERAKELIANTDLKVYEVAEAVGYPNANYFSKLFKRCTGLTPEEFKRH